jgi:hypothetical protein
VALQRLGERLGEGGVYKTAELTIDPSRCARCGDCAAGCNRPDAKKALATTYLRKAVETGLVQIVTQAEVYRFERSGTADRHLGWTVRVFSTDVQHQYLSTRELFNEKSPAPTARKLTAPRLYVCAGTFGSTQLLQRSQALADRCLAFSPALGTRLSGNGDSISVSANEPEIANSVGRGENGLREWDAWDRDGAAPKRDIIVGPTITGMIDLRGQDKPLEKRILIQDAAIPTAIAQAYRELLATAWSLRQLGDWWFERPFGPRGKDAEDPLAAGALADHTQVLLAMGHDGSPGRMVWLEGDDRSAPYLLNPEQLGVYVEQQRLFDKTGKKHVHNPLWRVLPEAALEAMDGPKPLQTITTVHPLGGCVMSEHPDNGVVDHLGRVWVHDPGRRFVSADAVQPPLNEGYVNSPRTYKGLYVIDGSIVPTSLGCNPLLTITALAERAMAHLPDNDIRRAPSQPAASPARSPRIMPSTDVAVSARLNEVLVGRAIEVGGELADVLRGRRVVARFCASFKAPNLLQAMRQERHAIAPKAELEFGCGDDPSGAEAAAVVYESEDEGEGQSNIFEPLPANWGSAGPWLLMRSLLEFAALPVMVGAAIYVTFTHGFTVRAFAILAAALLVAAIAVMLLPFWRTVLTWGVLRGVNDWRDRDQAVPVLRSLRQWLFRFPGLLKQWIHATEKRVMRYRIDMRRKTVPGEAQQRNGPTPPDRITLYAAKRVAYRASLGELVSWLLGRSPQLRPTFWEQVMDADVRVVRAGRPSWWPALAGGRFSMGFDNLLATSRSDAAGHSQPGAMELLERGDSTSGMLALASYPLLFLRFALKTRLLDFRLPNYSGLPVSDSASQEDTRLRVPGAAASDPGIVPELVWLEDVERGDSTSDEGDEPQGSLRLPLWRYRRRETGRPEVNPDAEWLGIPVARAKSVLLVHAFGQSGLMFTFKQTGQNLAEHFYEQGYEVWVLETRMSTRTAYALEPSTVDQIAQYDIRAAVCKITALLKDELKTDRPVQICAFAQCIGAAALWMSLLSGKLSHGDAPGDTAAAARGVSTPQLSMISHAMFSQVHPWIVGSPVTRAKTWVPALLRSLFNRGTVPFSVRGPQEGWFAPLMDRVFASMPAPAGESRRPRGDDDAAATCRRIRHIEAPLFLHENINDATFLAMNRLFGDANIRLFAHARRFVEKGKLVDEDGVNVYVTEANIRKHLAFPIQLLHGEKNELFDVDSAKHSYQMLQAIHPDWFEQFAPEAGIVEGYGHVDVLIGQDAAADVYPRVSAFFDKAFQADRHQVVAAAPAGWTLRAPRIGPFLGSVRPENGRVAMRLSFIIDDKEGAALGGAAQPRVLVRYRKPGGKWASLPPEQWQHSFYDARGHGEDEQASGPGSKGAVVLRAVRVDVLLDKDAAEGSLQVLSLHQVSHPAVKPLPEYPDDEAIDEFFETVLGRTRGPTPVGTGSGGRRYIGFGAAEVTVPTAALATLPNGADVSFSVACCRHPGFGLDQGRVDRSVERMLSEHEKEPLAFAMLLGDQIYADATAGLVDPTSPLERFYERHETAFSASGMRRLLRTLPTYMTPDDHEWTDAYPSGSPLVKERWPDWTSTSNIGFASRQKRAFQVAANALTAFQRFQRGGSYRSYRYQHGCVRVFVIDTRFARQRNSSSIVSPGVMASLRNWLQSPEARDCLNVVASGSVVLPGLRPDADPANPGVIDTWQYAPQERSDLLEMLVQHAGGAFLLLSGDYHVSAAAEIRCEGRTVGAAIVAPPLYAPLPYANATPEALDLEESIRLRGGTMDMSVPAGAEGARGSGWGRISVRKLPVGFEIAYRRDLWTWEAAFGQQTQAVIRLPGFPLPPPLQAPAQDSATVA